MNRKMAFWLCICIISMQAGSVYCGERGELHIKPGMREKTVNDTYGGPLMTESIKKGFLPAVKKIALYKIGDSDYMILYFFLGRVKNVTILDGAGHDEAIAVFRAEQTK